LPRVRSRPRLVPGLTEDETDPARFFTRRAYDRLREVKAAIDPENVFRANHPIAAAD
jgi:FAD/FMN-containing dehydrogenase